MNARTINLVLFAALGLLAGLGSPACDSTEQCDGDVEVICEGESCVCGSGENEGEACIDDPDSEEPESCEIFCCVEANGIGGVL